MDRRDTWLPWLRFLVWTLFTAANFVLFLLASNTDRVFEPAQLSKFYEVTNWTLARHHGHLLDNDSSDGFGDDGEGVLCERRVDKVVLYILDSFGYKMLVDKSKSSKPLHTLLNLIVNDSSRGRFFKVKSDGVLLTNSALFRIFFGKSGSLVESFNNRQNFKDVCKLSLFYELYKSDIPVSTLEMNLYQHLFGNECFNIQFQHYLHNESISHDTIFKSYNHSDLIILHNVDMDKKMHRFGEDSAHVDIELDKALEIVLSAIKTLEEKNENVLFILTGDHGFTDHNHGTDNEVQSNMPFLVFANFDGLFAPDHKPNVVYQEKQINIASTFALLFGTHINLASESNFIKEFFVNQSVNDSQNLMTCALKSNSNHLKTVLAMRKFYLQHSDYDKYTKIPATYDNNKLLMQKISLLPKLNPRMIKILALINTTQVVFSFIGANIFSVLFSICFFVTCLLFILQLWIGFIGLIVGLSIFLVILMLCERRKDKEVQMNSEKLYACFKPFTLLRILVFAANSTFSLQGMINFNRFIAYIAWFIMPGLITTLLCKIGTRLKALLLTNYSMCTIVIIIAFQYSSCKQTFIKQLCYSTVFTDWNYFSIAIISLMIFFIYAMISYQSGHICAKISIYTTIFALTVFVWLIRDIKCINRESKWQIYISLIIDLLHLFVIIAILSSVVVSIVRRDYDEFFKVAILGVIILCLISYEIKYAPVFLITIVVLRSLTEALMALFKSENSIVVLYENLIIKLCFFMIFLIYKQVSFHFFFLFGRELSLQNIYNMKLAFQVAFDNHSHWYTILYGVLTAFTPRIFVAIAISPIIFHFRDYLVITKRLSAVHMSVFLGPFLEAFFIWHSSFVFGLWMPLGYQIINTPQHSWNESELYYVLELFDQFWDTFFILICSLAYKFIPISKRIQQLQSVPTR